MVNHQYYPYGMFECGASIHSHSFRMTHNFVASVIVSLFKNFNHRLSGTDVRYYLVLYGCTIIFEFVHTSLICGAAHKIDDNKSGLPSSMPQLE